MYLHLFVGRYMNNLDESSEVLKRTNFVDNLDHSLYPKLVDSMYSIMDDMLTRNIMKSCMNFETFKDKLIISIADGGVTINDELPINVGDNLKQSYYEKVLFMNVTGSNNKLRKSKKMYLLSNQAVVNLLTISVLDESIKFDNIILQPQQYSKLVKKRNELAKIRAIYTVDIIHYLICSYVLEPIEKNIKFD